MDQAPGFRRYISLRTPAASVVPFPCSAPSRRPLPGSPGSTHPPKFPKSGEAPRRKKTAGTPLPSSALGPRICVPHPPPLGSFRNARPHTTGFRDCQKSPELDPVAGQFLSLETGRTPILTLPGLASNPLQSRDPFFICQMVPLISYLSCKEPWSQPLT